MNCEQRIKKIAAEHLNCIATEISNSASFDSLGADSLDLVEMVMDLEEEFDIEVNDEDAEKILTVQDAINYINNLKF